MSETAIAFPHLNIYLDPVPKNFTVFGFTIALYGVVIAIGIMLGFTLAAHVAKLNGLDPDLVWDFSVPAIIFSIIGARTYYVVMSWDMYKDDPISVLYLRQGGLAIYGGVIGGFLCMYFFVKKKGIPYLSFADLLSCGLLAGQIIGRWGNFFNREAFGRYTDNLLAMRLPIAAVRAGDISADIQAHIAAGTDYIQVHPTFLYEGMWNTLVLIVLLLHRKHRAFDGELFFMYIAGYGIGRFFIESLRTDQLLIPFTRIPVSMAVSSVSAAVAIILIFVFREKKSRGL